LRARYHTGLIGTINVRVAVHIRRGDVKQISERRWLPLEYYSKLMHQLESEYPQKTFIFDIVSEGQETDFEPLTLQFPDRVHFHLSAPSTNMRSNVGPVGRNQHLFNRKPKIVVVSKALPTNQKTKKTYDAFQVLVSADILILSRSTFSYLAGLYSKGIKIYPPDMWLTYPLWCDESDRWYMHNNISALSL